MACFLERMSQAQMLWINRFVLWLQATIAIHVVIR